MKIADFTLRVLKKGYRIITNKKFTNPKCDFNRQSVNDKIFDLLVSDVPCMIARFGTIELNCVNNYLCIHGNGNKLYKIFNYIVDKTQTPWWFEEHFKSMKMNAGIFPPTQETAERFSQLYLSDTPYIDLLGSFQYCEKFMPLRTDIQNVQLETLYPFFVERPWTRALKGKKVLVIHPFEETIKTQYQIKNKLFENTEILPDFELITFKAIQSAAGIEVPYKDWFEALKFMQDEISKIDFDICILGCGAYGLPLAAHIKRLGKKSFHIGGGLQLLFGIKGKRWDNHNYGVEEFKLYEGLMTKSYASLYNKYWIKPLEVDTPKTSHKIEGACYW